jgi:hypothetical protein
MIEIAAASNIGLLLPMTAKPLITNMQRASRSSQIPQLEKIPDGIDVYFGRNHRPEREAN